jgi:flagellar biosynthesis/type III secretory pathway M-ring protein FliF/YscJ
MEFNPWGMLIALIFVVMAVAGIVVPTIKTWRNRIAEEKEKAKEHK